MLDLEEGDVERPSGNLLAYSWVEGINPIQKDGKIIVCNVMISFIAAHHNHYPVIIFAPISLRNQEELDAMIQLKDNYDVYRLEDFCLPSNMDMEEYVKERVEGFNEVVVRYVDMCRSSVQKRSEFLETEFTNVNSESEDQKQDSTISKETKLNSNTVLTMNNEEESLNLLQKFVDERNWDQAEKVQLFRKCIRFFENKFPKYDIRNFERAVLNRINDKSNYIEDLSQLYLDKYRAIYAEQYEKAHVLQNRIKTVESIDLHQAEDSFFA